MTDFFQFLEWEATTKDTIDFKCIYADMADGDPLAGLMLSEIVYWHLPDKRGSSKLRVKHDDHMWIAVSRAEWWDRTRIGARTSDRLIAKLEKAGLVSKHVYRFNRTPTIHVRIIYDKFMELFGRYAQEPAQNPYRVKRAQVAISPNGEIGDESRNHQTVKSLISPNGEIRNHQTVRSLTETTAEITLTKDTFADATAPATLQNESERNDKSLPPATVGVSSGAIEPGRAPQPVKPSASKLSTQDDQVAGSKNGKIDPLFEALVKVAGYDRQTVINDKRKGGPRGYINKAHADLRQMTPDGTLDELALLVLRVPEYHRLKNAWMYEKGRRGPTAFPPGMVSKIWAELVKWDKDTNHATTNCNGSGRNGAQAGEHTSGQFDASGVGAGSYADRVAKAVAARQAWAAGRCWEESPVQVLQRAA